MFPCKVETWWLIWTLQPSSLNQKPASPIYSVISCVYLILFCQPTPNDWFEKHFDFSLKAFTEIKTAKRYIFNNYFCAKTQAIWYLQRYQTNKFCWCHKICKPINGVIFDQFVNYMKLNNEIVILVTRFYFIVLRISQKRSKTS